VSDIEELRAELAKRSHGATMPFFISKEDGAAMPRPIDARPTRNSGKTPTWREPPLSLRTLARHRALERQS
jgi:hypothetical protein